MAGLGALGGGTGRQVHAGRAKNWTLTLNNPTPMEAERWEVIAAGDVMGIRYFVYQEE